MNRKYDVVVIGGGPAGMMASIFAAKRGKSILLLEHNEKLGKKLYITGKGRCNITNDSSIDNHLNNIIRNPKFMYSALNGFSPKDVMEFFKSCGLNVVTERGGRVFPSSNKSSDVIKTLTKVLKENRVDIALNTNVVSISKNDNIFDILCSDNNTYTADSLIIACGGVSYSLTGSDGSVWEMIKNLGHNIVSPTPSLTRIVVKEDLNGLEYLELKNVRLSVTIDKKTYSAEGEMAFADNMLIGPIAITMSSYLSRLDLTNTKCELDLKIGLTEDELDAKFIREFKLTPAKKLYTYLNTVIPHSFVNTFATRLQLENKNLADITKQERLNIIRGLKHFSFTIIGLDNIDRAIITSGGVDTKEINSKTMESKLVSNLYFAGEVIDVDALTGGYNLQIAWSTGKLAGDNVK